MTLPPTEHPVPMMKLYRAAAARFAADGREALRRGDPGRSAAEFGKAVVLGRLLFEDPGATFIQDAIGPSVLTRGTEGLGDAALARGDREAAAACERVLGDARAYLEGVARFVRGMPYAKLVGAPASQRDAVASVAALDAPAVRFSLRLEILMLAAVARPLLEPEDAPLAVAALHRVARDPDPRIRSIALWGKGLRKDEARRVASAVAANNWWWLTGP